ncbi:MAG: hypothetical protein JKX85_06910 [Phycisphaeraceae bacterium]|nr:hypothetical protein [Phycisphaeraceae bacterium]
MVHLFALLEKVDKQTGEISMCRNWLGTLLVDSSVLDELQDEGDSRRRRRILHASSVGTALHAIEAAAGHRIEWIGFNRVNLSLGATGVPEVVT